MKKTSFILIGLLLLLAPGCSNGDVLSERVYNIKVDLEFEEMQDSSLTFPVAFENGNIEVQVGDQPTGKYSLGENVLDMSLSEADGNMEFTITELEAQDEEARELEGVLSEFEFDSIAQESELALNMIRNGATGSTVRMTRIDDE
ncbi:hypothetical protein ACFOU0_08305 [Salinicoccus sesuvii]|uniref:Uncharacterized protein n=1 Tax=Salinicoccus sesuvii TaxID=868281 RepID=A0ABV7N6Q1_9STAP